MAGVGNGADKVMLMREFGRYPVMWHWVALATRFGFVLLRWDPKNWYAKH